MSKSAPSEPVCLYDLMATSAALDAGFSPSDSAAPQVSTGTIVAASVGSTLGVVALVGAITYFVLRRRRASRSMQAALL
jgi:hypothetical protein